MRPLFISLLFSGCDGVDLAQNWQLDRIRILAISAAVDQEPDPVLGSRAEPRPGENVLFDALYYVPMSEMISGAFWVGCIPESDLSYGCELDPSAFEGFNSLDENASFEEFEAALEAARAGGFIGLEPDLAPSWTVPENALEGFSEAEQKEGTNAFVNVSLLGDDVEMDAEPAEIGFKRFPVSLADTPNHNPEIIDFLVNEEALNGTGTFEAETGKTYRFTPVIPPGHIETYQYITEAGDMEYRSEEPYITWFSELGSTEAEKRSRFDQEYSLYPYTVVEWTAPKVTGTIQIYAVIRDRRGGMSWASLEVNVL